MHIRSLRVKEASDVDRLLDLSERVGRDPLLVQAGTGNTSLKLKGVLWIKASGKWLARAKLEKILVPIDLREARRYLERNQDIAAAYENRYHGELRPSIETAMHAVLPHRVVVHVHSVNTIAWAVRQDAPAQLATRLAGLDWQWIPFVPSGVPLALEIQKHLSCQPLPAVFVLGNHGLVIGAECCGAAEKLLFEVERRLALHPRLSQQSDCIPDSSIAADSYWRLPQTTDLHVLGSDRISRRVLSQGILYPCQAIFLGSNPPPTCRSGSLSSMPKSHQGRVEIPASFLIVGYRGVRVRANLTGAEYEMLAGLMQIVQRVDPSASIRYLTPSEVLNVLDKEMGKYRAVVESSAPLTSV
jgi:rhamnose utilization protein RhaD (predicted bifunctional aldolase and dehydrogenase)